MSRLIKRDAKGPSEIKTKSGDSVWICKCGLTANEDGTCSGAHKKVQDEKDGKMYKYDDEGNREESEKECCGRGCCGSCED